MYAIAYLILNRKESMIGLENQKYQCLYSVCCECREYPVW